MPRVPRVWGLPVLGRATPTATTTPLASTTARASSTSRTQTLRKSLWKDGDAPGAEDPYTQRPEEQPAAAVAPERSGPSSGRDRTPRPVRETRLAMPARRTEATAESEVEKTDPSYTPATSLDDLVEVQALGTWWDRPGHWGPESQFRGFARSNAGGKIVDPDLVQVHLRRALVEVLALRETGHLAAWATRAWADDSADRAALDAVLRTPVSVTADGAAGLPADQAQAIAGRLTAVQDEAQAEVEAGDAVSVDEARELVKSWDASWKDVVLDTETKFAIRKRVYQLTGNLIPDARLGAARTVRHLLTAASKQPKAPKLAELLLGNEAQKPSDLADLPNVTVHQSKIGPIDREVQVGRWKVIEAELKKRGLPVTGIDGLAGHKEKKWMRGEE